MILVTAIEHNEVLGAGFQMVALPAASDSARFLKILSGLLVWRGGESGSYQPYTATGKLNADITPTTPRGFGTMDNLNKNYYGLKAKEFCTFEDSMPRSFRIDHTAIHHP